MMANNFSGFKKATIQFYDELQLNNDRIWFEKHKEKYKTDVIEPAVEFVKSMGARLQTLSPSFIADTRTNGSGSIFRIYRDVRFSKDKRPYKTFLGIFFWEGVKKKMFNPGFYFHLEANKLMLFAGMHDFPKDALKIYRDAVVSQKGLYELKTISSDILAGEGYKIGGKHYKRIPRGYEQYTDNEFLYFSGLYAHTESGIPEELYSDALVDYCFNHFKFMYPLHQWLSTYLGGDNDEQ